MWHVRQPSNARLNALVAAQAGKPFSYRAVAATQTIDRPDFAIRSFDVDHCCIDLGSGSAAFEAGRQAIRNWQMFNLAWARIFPCPEPIRAGTIVALVARGCGLWVTGCCRIVYTIDEPQRYGFAYGTLDDHPEQGEERFLIQQDESGRVSFEIRAFSRPQAWLSRLGYPIMRYYQAQFRRDAPRAVARFVAKETA